MKERTIQQQGNSIRVRELFKAYQEWCVENNEHIVSERFLSLRLQEMGYERTRNAEARFWAGIALRV